MVNSTAGGGEHSSPRRIGVSDARQMLGMIGGNYDDEDLAEVLEILYGLAEEGYETFLANADQENEGSR